MTRIRMIAATLAATVAALGVATPPLALTVTCGMPALHGDAHENPTSGPPEDHFSAWPGAESGHGDTALLLRRHPDSGIAVEIWPRSEGLGWWRMVWWRQHPDDIAAAESHRTIVESPFLAEAAVVAAGDDETWQAVMDAVAAAMPPADRLRCR